MEELLPVTLPPVPGITWALMKSSLACLGVTVKVPAEVPGPPMPTTVIADVAAPAGTVMSSSSCETMTKAAFTTPPLVACRVTPFVSSKPVPNRRM